MGHTLQQSNMATAKPRTWTIKFTGKSSVNWGSSMAMFYYQSQRVIRFNLTNVTKWDLSHELWEYIYGFNGLKRENLEWLFSSQNMRDISANFPLKQIWEIHEESGDLDQQKSWNVEAKHPMLTKTLRVSTRTSGLPSVRKMLFLPELPA